MTKFSEYLVFLILTLLFEKKKKKQIDSCKKLFLEVAIYLFPFRQKVINLIRCERVRISNAYIYMRNKFSISQAFSNPVFTCLTAQTRRYIIVQNYMQIS